MLSSDLQSLLRALPTSPTSDDLARLAEDLARTCQQRSQPRKSLAMYLRNAASAAPPKVLRALGDLAIEHLERGISGAPVVAPSATGSWVDVAEAARVLGLRRLTLTERLKQPVYRALYGWPYWDGHQWWFSSLAIDPATRVEYLARLPEREPAAHVAMLPTWCIRQDAAAAEAAA